jgi:TPR repeat protein
MNHCGWGSDRDLLGIRIGSRSNPRRRDGRSHIAQQAGGVSGGGVREAGAGTMKRTEHDLKSLRQQAKQGDAWAQFTLGEMYRKGEGVAQNSAEAARWYRRLAANSI